MRVRKSSFARRTLVQTSGLHPVRCVVVAPHAPRLIFLLFFFGVVALDGLPRRLDICCFAYLGNVPHVVRGIT